ncbi:DUF481 domain-containing protein [Engelhardtia mirabilis]|uniref:Salt-induced outer membrane protein n=1 Tax=Engelhardtia mirabilis TaxID=2528011 RepID=A0A518BQK8_9BACT|nr:hypothetical protein Pla133_43470 [Planctomycetes bacterium Pla133]QDV03557.1 hypothetical protein Pla86_43460 [Planctomycetes bacterium Pla86]
MSLILSVASAAALLGSAQPQPTEYLPAYGAPLPAPILTNTVQDEVPHNVWTGAVTIGATITSGNTDLRQANADANAEYRREDDRTSLEAYWTYADEKDSTTNVRSLTQRQVYAKAQYDYFFSEETYAYGNVSGLSDAKKALDLRLTVGAGIGQQWFEDEDKAFSTEIGVSYVDENYKVDSQDVDYAAGRFAFNYRNQLNEETTFEQNGELLVSLDNANDTIGMLDTRVRTNLSETMFGQIQWVMDYDNTPVPGNDRLDHRVVLSIGWTF